MTIHEVTRKVEATLRDKEIALGAFIDIEGAFDNTLISSIQQAMESREVHSTVRRWVTTMLKHRQVYTTLNDHTVGAIATRGCPQGGVLSPLLWCLVVDDLLCGLTKAGYTTVGYADDIVTLIRGKFWGTVSEMMQGP